ncbi:Maleylacetate reductase [compost metagenome]
MVSTSWALGSEDGVAGLVALGRSLGVPCSLHEIGMPADGLERAADLAVSAPYPNPRPLDREALRALLQRAFDGAEPS